MALTRLGLNQSINLASNVTGTLATGNGGTGATSFAPGKILQIVNGTHSSEKNSSTSTYATTGVTASITPSSSSNTILVTVHISGVAKFGGTGTGVGLKVFRGTATSDPEINFFSWRAGNTADNGNYNFCGSCSTTFSDSPSSTSAVNYTVFFNSKDNTSTARIQDENTTSTITLMEIQA